MTTKRDFSASEWKQIINAPQLIYHAFISGEKSNILQKRSEAKALATFLGGYKSGSSLVKSIVADQDEADDKIDGSYVSTIAALKKIGNLLDKKAPGSDGDAARKMLKDAADAIAEAVRETPGLRSKNVVSKKEAGIIADIEEALQATAADARERRAASARGAKPTSRAKAAGAAAVGVAGMTAAETARRKKEVEARAATRRAEKASENMSAAEAAKRKAEVDKRAAERRAKKAAEERTERRESAQDAAMERKQEREAKERAAKRAEAQQKAKADRAKAAADARAAKQAAAEAAKVRTYTVAGGDSLSVIAQKMYGNGNKWREIYEANKDVIKDPNIIHPGMELKIPNL